MRLGSKHTQKSIRLIKKARAKQVDGYDEKRNAVIEVDEQHHFDKKGCLKKKDVIRQKEIEDFLKCKFIRITAMEILNEETNTSFQN